MEEIERGAEAVIYKDKDFIIKKRISKGYRIREIDEKIRKLRTRSEAKILNKLDFVPKVFNFDDKKMEIKMEFIDGLLIRDVINDIGKKEKICFEIGKNISIMHNLDIIHGDLTTSNFILKDNKVYFIDFGLGFVSTRVEDKATDLRLLRQALDSKHFLYSKEIYNNILKEYRDKEVLNWLEKKVEKRGKYKRKSLK